MNDNHIFEKSQSGFHYLHSTETALVKVANDLFLAADSGLYSVLILLDLSSAFDTVDHNVLISRVKNYVGIIAENFLQLNDSKSDIVIMSPSSPSTSIITNLSSSLGTLSNNVQKEAWNLGVIFDSELSFDTRVTKVVQSCFAQLRLLTKIRSFLSSADLEKVNHAFISTRLDYCNTLYSGISRRNIQRLQLIQNAAARFLTCTKRCDHITPILAALHWLPVSFRIDFKILLLVFKALNG